MTNLTRIPRRLNGYEIIAILTRTQPNDRPSDSEAVILGHDTTRRFSKYVTAMVSVADPAVDHISDPPVHREWYWGHYFEDYDQAMRSLIRRANASLAICEHKREPDQHCTTLGCPNFFDSTMVTL